METGQTAIRFGVFEVEIASGELRRQGVRIRIHDKSLQLLLALLERPGELVTRQELQRRLWSDDTFVAFDNNLNNAVSRLRDALGDAADRPRFVETVPRRGYRFIAPVVAVRAPIDPAAAPLSKATATLAATVTPPPRTPRTAVIAASLAVFVGLAALVAGIPYGRSWLHGPEPAAQVRALAVLPFVDLSRNADQEYFADGLTEALILELSKTSDLRIISRTSAMHYKGTGKRAPQIGRELGVDALVEGSIAREGDRVRVTVQLIEAPTDAHLWSESYEQDLSSMLALQRDVARAIAGQIRRNVSAEPAATAAAGRMDPDTYQRYLRGRHLLNRRTEPELQKALEYFEQVIAAAPEHAPAHAAVAAVWEAMASWGNYVPPRDGFPKAKAAALRALALDPNLAEAHVHLGFVEEVYEWRLEAAERAYKRAIVLDPSHAPAYQRYALHLSRTRREQEALEMAKRAQALDPLSLDANVMLALRWLAVGKVDEARRSFEHSIELDPNYYDTWVHLSHFYEATGKKDDQIAAAKKGVDLSGAAPHALHALARAHAFWGNRVEAQAIADTLTERATHRNAYEMGTLHLQLRQPEPALRWLQRACDERTPAMAFLHVAQGGRDFELVRDDARFRTLLQCPPPVAAADAVKASP